MSHEPPGLKSKPESDRAAASDATRALPESDRAAASDAMRALPDSHTVSALMREYAEPLLYADPAGPADLETMRTSLMLAMICWNLPVYEAAGHPLYEKGVQTLDKVRRNVPRHVASALQLLVEKRKQSYAAAPFLISVDVTGTTPEDASIVAHARLVRSGGGAPGPAR